MLEFEKATAQNCDGIKKSSLRQEENCGQRVEMLLSDEAQLTRVRFKQGTGRRFRK